MNDMDEIDKLLKMASPPESDEARKSAISSGLDAFDQHFAKTRQGMPPGNRLMDAVRTFHNMVFGDIPMKKTQLLGGLATIAIGVALLNSSSLTSLIPGVIEESTAVNKVKKAPESVTPSANIKSSDMAPTSLGSLPAPPQQDSLSSFAAQSAGSVLTAPTSTADASKLPPPPAPMLAGKGRSGAAAKQEMKAKEFESARREGPEELSGMLMSLKNQAPAKDRLQEPERKKAMEKAMAVPASPALSSPAIANGISAAQSYASAPPELAYRITYGRPDDANSPYYRDEGRDKFDAAKLNPMKAAKEEPVSTFSVDVDTSSYSFMRASLNRGVMPTPDSVRVEELVNYFPYAYELPESRETPFKANVSVMPTPWNSKTKLIHIGIKGYDIEQKDKPHSNLVFLIDTSGSMNEPNKLPLLVNSLKLLLDTLKPDDTVSIVTYAGYAGVALPPTQVSEKSRILTLLDSLGAGGSTAGSEGIRTAYELAKRNFDKEGVNRVILATDGDFNVGLGQEQLKQYVETERKSGVFLSVLGFGMGNYNDAMMQALAQNGNGNAAYIDNLNEARKVLVEEAGSTLFTIAKDVKIQVEFNPAKVAEYRLVGYETRMLNREDFNNDKVDAGDIGAGHTVTALYEIVEPGSEARTVDDLRYGDKKAKKEEKEVEKKEASDEYAFVKIRYKLPDSDTSKLITTPVDSKVEFKELSAVPQEARFAASVAAYAQLLRGENISFTYDDVVKLAESAKGTDSFGYRAEFVNLVRLAAHASGFRNGNGYNPQPVEPQPYPMPAPGVIR